MKENTDRQTIAPTPARLGQPSELTCVAEIASYILRDDRGEYWCGWDIPVPGEPGGVMGHLLPGETISAGSLHVALQRVTYTFPAIVQPPRPAGQGEAIPMPVEVATTLSPLAGAERVSAAADKEEDDRT